MEKRSNSFKKRRKICFFSKNKIDYVNYKDVKQLLKYMTEGGQIAPRRISGNCAFHQRMVAEAIKRARVAALVPYLVK